MIIISGAASGGASFIVHPNSEINSIEDFSGKKIAAPQIGNTQDVSLRSYLLQNGLAPAQKGGSVVIFNIANPDIYTLFVKGELSDYINPSDKSLIKQTFPNVILKTIPGASHWIHSDAPEELLALLTEFIR